MGFLGSIRVDSPRFASICDQPAFLGLGSPVNPPGFPKLSLPKPWMPVFSSGQTAVTGN
jgi:hypothetical protein